MNYSQGDVVWLRTDNIEGGLGKRHPCIVLSNNDFNDSHEWGILVRGSHTVPKQLLPEEYVIKRNKENGLDQDTVFGSIIFSAKWERITRVAGKIPPTQIRQLVRRIQDIVTA